MHFFTVLAIAFPLTLSQSGAADDQESVPIFHSTLSATSINRPEDNSLYRQANSATTLTTATPLDAVKGYSEPGVSQPAQPSLTSMPTGISGLPGLNATVLSAPSYTGTRLI